MNKTIEDLMYHAGLTASGCWDEMDAYDRKAIVKFSQLIVADCLNIIGRYEISGGETAYGWTYAALTDIYSEIRERFSEQTL
jgi:hypothetical protein